MPDVFYKGRLESMRLAFAYAVTTAMANEAIVRHNCDPVAAHLLGRALAAGLMATAPLGEKERLNIRWAYQGRARTIVVDAGPDGSTRGFISPPNLADAASEQDLYGDVCEVRVIRSQDGVVTSSGTIRSCLQDVVDDLVHFHCTSDQVESVASVLIGFTADERRPVALCRGLLLHALPGCDLKMLDRVRERAQGEAFRARLSHDAEADNLVEDVLNLLVRPETNDPGLQLAEAGSPVFRCACNRDKMGAVLRSLPYAERMDIAQKKEDVVVHCHFCNERYTMTVDECIRAWNEKVG
jgi:molecular chaperone Hsp33